MIGAAMEHYTERHLAGRFGSRRTPVYGTQGMVAASQPLAAQAGLQMLLAGGTAADAAVATAAALVVVEPMSTGIGGDAFALVYDAGTGAVRALNGSGRAPQALTRDLIAARGHTEMPLLGWLPVTVPGAVAAWADLLAAHGRMTLAEVLAPAIRYAEAGFAVSETIARGWAHLAPKIAQQAAAARTYLIDGKPPLVGTVVRQPGLARSLRLIAEHGAAAMYTGELAQAIVAASEREGGVLALEDLAAHTSTWQDPLRVRYRDVEVLQCPPNGQGIVALMALGILDGLDLAAHPAGSPAALHLQIEALRLAFADAAAYVADPAMASVPVELLLSDANTARRRALIDPAHAMTRVPITPLPGGHDTVYFSIVDAAGNAVSFINSLYYGFGAGVVAGETGICMQNRGAGFVLDAAHPNALEPGKRPYHTIIPGMALRDGRLWASFGVMGGFMQPQGHVQTLVNLIDYRMNAQEALDAPRFELIEPYRAQKSVALEYGAPMRAALAALGHDIAADRSEQFGFGGGQIITVDAHGVRCGGTDPRKDGSVVAY